MLVAPDNVRKTKTSNKRKRNAADIPSQFQFFNGNLLSMPRDILDKIFSWVDEPLTLINVARVSKKFKEQTDTNKEIYRNIAKKYFRHFLEEDWKQEFDANPKKVIFDYIKKHSNDLATFSTSRNKTYLIKYWLKICSGKKDVVKSKYTRNYMNPRIYTMAMGNFIDMIGCLDDTEFNILAKKLIEDRNLKLVKYLFETEMHKQRAKAVFRNILLSENVNVLAKNAPHLLSYLVRQFPNDDRLLDHIFLPIVKNQHVFIERLLKDQPELTVARINRTISKEYRGLGHLLCSSFALEKVTPYFEHLSENNRYLLLKTHLEVHPVPHEMFFKLLSQVGTISDDNYYHCLKSLGYRKNAVVIFEALTAKRELDHAHRHFEQTISFLFEKGMINQIELSRFIFQKYRAFFTPEKLREVLQSTSKNLVLFLSLTGYKFPSKELSEFCYDLLKIKDPNNHLSYFISNYSKDLTVDFIEDFLIFAIFNHNYAKLNMGCIAALSYSRPNELLSFFSRAFSVNRSWLSKINSLFKNVFSTKDITFAPLFSDAFLNSLLMELEKTQQNQETLELAQQIKTILKINALRKKAPLKRSLEEDLDQTLIPIPKMRYELPLETSSATVVPRHCLPIFELSTVSMDTSITAHDEGRLHIAKP